MGSRIYWLHPHEGARSLPRKGCPEYIFMYLPNLFPMNRVQHKDNFFKRRFSGLNSELSFSYTSCYTTVEEPNLPYYIPITEKIVWCVRFPRVLTLCEIQTASFKIWTRIIMSISYDDNCYPHERLWKKVFTQPLHDRQVAIQG